LPETKAEIERWVVRAFLESLRRRAGFEASLPCANAALSGAAGNSAAATTKKYSALLTKRQQTTTTLKERIVARHRQSILIFLES
jgi:hypothetical protein